MFGYIMVGTNDKDKARVFYDGLLGELGHKRIFDKFHMVAWGKNFGEPWFSVCTPIDKEDACVGNGTMVAFALDSEEDVDRMYKKAIELGGTSEGEPGLRAAGFYCAYFRDLDGNKFNFHTPGAKLREAMGQ
ncbi:MAG: VOC family protein [Pseudomonadota bacterium]